MTALSPTPLPTTMSERPAVLLVFDLQEWPLRSIESVLAPRGFSVTRAYGGRQALDLVERLRPDALLIGAELGDLTAEEFLRELPRTGAWGRGLPVAVLQACAESRSETVALLDAGAWAVVAPPVDSDVLVAQVTAFVRARREIERLQHEALVDDETGLWAPAGLQRRAQELLGDALRHGRALACVVVTFSDDSGAAPLLAVADALRATVRQSDVLARSSRRELVLLAGADTAEHVDLLLSRVHGVLSATTIDVPPRAGVATAVAYRDTRETLDDLLARARAANVVAG